LLRLEYLGRYRSAASAVKDGRVVTVAEAGGHAITMISRVGQALAALLALGQDGGSFSVLESAL